MPKQTQMSEKIAHAELAVAKLVLNIAIQENSHEYIVAYLNSAVIKAQKVVDSYSKPWLNFFGNSASVVNGYSEPFSV